MKSIYSLPTDASESMKTPQVSVAIIVSLFKSETPLLDSPSFLTNNFSHPFANDDIVCAHNISKPSPPIVGHPPLPTLQRLLSQLWESRRGRGGAVSSHDHRVSNMLGKSDFASRKKNSFWVFFRNLCIFCISMYCSVGSKDCKGSRRILLCGICVHGGGGGGWNPPPP